MTGEPAIGNTAGFTLAEAIVALSLSTVLVLMVTTVFIAQSDFYDDVLRRSGAHDDARGVIEVVSSDVRKVMPDGIILADSLAFAARIPLTLAMVCEMDNTLLSVLHPETAAGLDTDDVTGYAVRDGSGGWIYGSSTWSDLYYDSGSTAKADCGSAGADTVGLPTSNFVRLYGPWFYFVPVPAAGDPFLLTRDVKLEFADSDLDTATVGLYRGTYGQSLVEFASGLGDDARFEYRLQGNSSFQSSVSSGNLSQINSIRIVAQAFRQEGAGGDSYEFELIQDVPLRNVP